MIRALWLDGLCPMSPQLRLVTDCLASVAFIAEVGMGLLHLTTYHYMHNSSTGWWPMAEEQVACIVQPAVTHVRTSVSSLPPSALVRTWVTAGWTSGMYCF